MGPHVSQEPQPPEPIPASFYARTAEARQPRPFPAAVMALGIRALRRRVPLPGSWRPTRVVAGWILAGGLLACVALLTVLPHVLASPSGGLASGRSSPSPPVASSPTASPSPPPDATPAPVVEDPSPVPARPSAPAGAPSPLAASVTFLNAPLAGRRGRSVSLEVRTTPGTVCSIDLGYASAPDLGPATSDAGGGVSWSWRVGGPAPSGSWPVTVTCGGATATTQIVLG